ncbi:hypothetical protein DFR26_1316 [Paraperlucidibaca baekdonensis]|uniref:Ribbon-helix-helix CopG family protein n=1 Tax=Paraperlucidibaca baekdonensis TaxID=748120 RepID=A0A3E0H6W3_9GAMM|nr:hypothetical protein [Paraperlucidibaca baekdonensis]REH39135.1 hypothetical protein DFR26_1316 [Paraperlucidibaca baekdonensis]
MSDKSSKKKNAQLIIRITEDERAKFVALCEQQDTSAAREIRRFIRGYLDQHQADDRQR